MRNRMYFVLPDIKHSRKIFKDLLFSRIEAGYIHVLAKAGTDLGDLPEATTLQRSDVVHGAGVGLVVGGISGAVVGGLILLYPPTGFSVGLGVVLAMSLLGAVMGVWVSGMIGTSTPNTHLRGFDGDIENGKVLMIVDVPKNRTEEITRHITKRHPRAEMRGIDPTHPVPFP